MLKDLLERIRRLNEIGIALSCERNTAHLLEKILLHAKWLTSADGATIYTVTPDEELQFEMVVNDTLNLEIKGEKILFERLPLFIEDKKNESHIVAYTVHQKKSVLVEDAYQASGFDFTGTRQFDAKTGYRTRSVLTLPILDLEGRVVAALQLINPHDPKTSFTKEDQELGESLASQAGVALTNQRLIQDLKTLFEGMIKMVAKAIDEKSPSTGKHSRRVPILCKPLAEAYNSRYGKTLSDEEIYELEVAAFLHDIGKLTTPTAYLFLSNSFGWNFAHNQLDFYNGRMEVTWSQHLATALEFRHRGRYAWRKADFYNFLLDATREEDLLLASPLSDRRSILLADLFYRINPDNSIKLQLRKGFDRVRQPAFFEYQLELDHLLFQHWHLHFTYEKRTEDHLFGITLKLDPASP